MRVFFSTLPGVLTAVAALITAIVGLLAFLADGDNGSDEERAAWVSDVNRLCVSTAERIDEIELAPSGDAYSIFYADHSEAMEGLVEDFRQLSPPSGLEAQSTQLIGLWAQSGDDFLQASLQTTERERGGTADRAYESMLRAGDIAGGLGASACTDLAKD